MRRLAMKYLQIALLKMLNDLGCKTGGGDVFPRVEISSIDMSEGADKAPYDFVVTFILDIITKSVSQLESLDILENIRANFISLEVEHFYTDGLVPENCSQITETTDTEFIHRQVQRYRIYLTQKS